MKIRSKPLIVAGVIAATVALNATIILARPQSRARPTPPQKARVSPGMKPSLTVQATSDVPGLASIRMAGRSADPRSRAHEHAFWVTIHHYRDPDGPPVVQETWTEPHQRLTGPKGQSVEGFIDRAYNLPAGKYLVRAGLANMKRPEKNEDRRPGAVRGFASLIRPAVVDVE